jgi:hypothetical protein
VERERLAPAALARLRSERADFRRGTEAEATAGGESESGNGNAAQEILGCSVRDTTILVRLCFPARPSALRQPITGTGSVK